MYISSRLFSYLGAGVLPPSGKIGDNAEHARWLVDTLHSGDPQVCRYPPGGGGDYDLRSGSPLVAGDYDLRSGILPNPTPAWDHDLWSDSTRDHDLLSGIFLAAGDYDLRSGSSLVVGDYDLWSGSPPNPTPALDHDLPSGSTRDHDLLSGIFLASGDYDLRSGSPPNPNETIREQLIATPMFCKTNGNKSCY